MSNAPRRLVNPPIIEACLELRATFAQPIAMADLERFCAAIAAAYPGSKRQQEWTSQVSLGSPQAGVIAPSLTETGFVLTSPDGLHVVQARVDGMRFSRLKPYSSWGEFRDEARRLWALYVKVLSPQLVHRVAVRYINRIELPMPVDLKTYFKTGPEIAPGLPQSVGQFFFRVVIPTTPTTDVIFTQMTDTPLTPLGHQGLPVVIDIDASGIGAFDVSGAPLWEAAEQLRVVKNDFFFGSLTEKGIGLFAGGN